LFFRASTTWFFARNTDSRSWLLALISGSSSIGEVCKEADSLSLEIEVMPDIKARATGFAQIYRWVDGNYTLAVKRDRGEPLIVMRLRHALEVAKVAEGKTVEAALMLLPEEGAGSTVVERARSRISAMPHRW
jgi:hypothetical protein